MLKFNPLLRSARFRVTAGARQMMRSPWRQPFKRFQTTVSNSKPPSEKPKGIKALVKEYGYSALGVYFGLSMLDLPLFYLLVHSMGKEQIEYYENKVKQTFGYGVSDDELKTRQEINKIHESTTAEEETAADSSFFSDLLAQFSWAEFALAYGIHKSFIFIRLPITAAITPTIVKTLRGWGFKLGTDKLAASAAHAKTQIKDYTAANPKFGTKASQRKKWFSWFF